MGWTLKTNFIFGYFFRNAKCRPQGMLRAASCVIFKGGGWHTVKQEGRKKKEKDKIT